MFSKTLYALVSKCGRWVLKESCGRKYAVELADGKDKKSFCLFPTKGLAAGYVKSTYLKVFVEDVGGHITKADFEPMAVDLNFNFLTPTL